MTTENVSLSSSDRVLIQSTVHGVDKWVIHSLHAKEPDMILDRFSSVSAISPDGNHLIAVERNMLRVFDTTTKRCIGYHSIPENCVIHRVKWSDNGNAYGVSTHGILRFQLEDMNSLPVIANIDLSLDVEAVYDIQIDENCEFYVVQMFDGTMEKMQYGKFNSSHCTVKRGCAACILHPNNGFISGHSLLIYLEKEVSKSPTYTLCSESISENGPDPGPKYPRTFGSDIEDHTPIYLVPDDQGSYVTVCTNNGCFLLFDALNGICIFTFIYDFSKVIAVTPHPSGGFIFMRENQLTIMRTTLDPQSIVSAYATLRNIDIEAFHMACRLQLVSPDCRFLYPLIKGLYKSKKKEAIAQFKILAKSLTLIDSMKMMSLIEQNATLIALNKFLWKLYSSGKQIQWLKEIENWCNQQCETPLRETQRVKATEPSRGTPDVISLANQFRSEGVSLESDAGKAVLKKMFPDPFDRVKYRTQIRKLMEDMEMEEYKKLADRMKEKGIQVEDEYWIAILEEIYEDEQKRETANKEIRQFM